MDKCINKLMYIYMYVCLYTFEINRQTNKAIEERERALDVDKKQNSSEMMHEMESIRASRQMMVIGLVDWWNAVKIVFNGEDRPSGSDRTTNEKSRTTKIHD